MTSTVARSAESAHLLFVLARKAEDKSAGKLILKCLQLRHGRRHTSEGKCPSRGPALHRDRPVLIEAPDLRRHWLPGDTRHLPERHRRRALVREDIQSCADRRAGRVPPSATVR